MTSFKFYRPFSGSNKNLQNLSVLLIESGTPKPLAKNPGAYSNRVSAVNPASIELFKSTKIRFLNLTFIYRTPNLGPASKLPSQESRQTPCKDLICPLKTGFHISPLRFWTLALIPRFSSISPMLCRVKIKIHVHYYLIIA